MNDKISLHERRLLSRLTSDYQEIYNPLSQKLKQILPFSHIHLDYLNNHGIIHSQNIIIELSKLLSGRILEITKINPLELLLLLCSAWLHDVGLLVNKDKDGKELSDEEIKERHHELSANLIREKYSELNIPDQGTADALADICYCHSRKVNIKEYFQFGIFKDNRRYLPDNSVRPAFLSAIFRLADALDTTSKRSPEMILKIAYLPEISNLHWKACQLIEGIDYNFEQACITVDAHFNTEGERKKLIWKIADLYEEYQSVKDLLIRHSLVLVDFIYRMRNLSDKTVEDLTSKPILKTNDMPSEIIIESLLREEKIHLEREEYIFAADCNFRIFEAIESKSDEQGIEVLRKGLKYLLKEEKQNSYKGIYFGPYFLKTFQKYYQSLLTHLTNGKLTEEELDFIKEVDFIHKNLDYITQSEKKGLETIFNSLLSGKSPLRLEVKDALEIIRSRLFCSPDGSLHNQCCLCTATAIIEFILAGEQDIIDRSIDWLVRQKDLEWRGIKNQKRGFQYLTFSLHAFLLRGEEKICDEIVNIAFKNKGEWETMCERDPFEIKGNLLYMLGEYFRMKKRKAAKKKLKNFDLFISEIENFIEEFSKQDFYSQTAAIKGLLLDDLIQNSILKQKLISLAKKTIQDIKDDPVFDKDTAGWGNDLLNTLYRTNARLAYWEHTLRINSKYNGKF